LNPESIESFESVYFLHQSAEPEDVPEAGTTEDDQDENGPVESGEGEILRGLHAKLYLADAGEEARIWTGSANATHAAFSGNVEFLVQLSGERSVCGIDRILETPQDSTGFMNLLQGYVAPEQPPEPDDTRERLEETADKIRRAIVGASLRAIVRELPEEPDRYGVVLEASKSVDIDEDVTVSCWPIRLSAREARMVANTDSVLADFAVSLEAISSFFAFAVTASEGDTSFSRRFVVNAEVVGAPANRKDAIVTSLLSDPGRILKLILMLLAEGSPNEREIALAFGTRELGEGGSNGSRSLVEVPLFEEMVRALWSNPTALDRIDGMLAVVRKSEETANLIPKDLDEVWPQIMEARRGLTKGES
jgi:hypothetical protein